MLTLFIARSKMKFPCILFATGVYIAAFALIDNVAAQVKGYENLDEFLTEVKTTAGSLLDYVTKMQALFCPNQPVCGADGELERKDVLGTLPAVISLGDVTVSVGGIADSVDICCMPCSCSDSCWKVNNCCATKQLHPDTSKNSTAVEHECIAASVGSYGNKLNLDQSQTNHMFHMVTSCFLDNSNLTLVAECQHPDPDALSNNIPVTSQKTGNTYWNKPCATCNDDDDDDIIEWTPYVILKINIPYFSNGSSLISNPYPDKFEKLSAILNSRRLSNIMYIPPESIMAENHKCIREELVKFNCKQPSAGNSSTLDRLVESCMHIFSPVHYGFRDLFYKNIFSLVSYTSLELIANKPVCKSKEEIKASPGYLTTLFNYKLEPDQPAPLEVDDEKCDCTEMFDPYLNLCRPQYCSSGEIQASCHCIQPFRQLSGMPVALMVKVTSRKDGSDSLTSGQLRKLHTTLENSLEAIAVNTTAEIATTLYVQQENATSLTYLTIVIAYSDWGTDTKLAMRPFLRYLDTDEVLDLNIGKLHLSAILTTNARLWTEFDGVRGTFKACCLDQQPNQLVEVYANKDVVNSGNNIGYGIYQPMSRLLYCKQVELNQTEHCITDSGILYINATEPMIATSDYHSVSESQVRVCADVYVPKASRKAKTSVGALCGCSVEVMIINLLSVVVTCMIY